MEQSCCTGALYLDLRKAFDTVHHGTLIDKLICYGIHNTELAWFENYLFNRKQFVCYDQATSQTEQMTYGVPQGSILVTKSIQCWDEFVAGVLPDLRLTCRSSQFAASLLGDYRG